FRFGVEPSSLEFLNRRGFDLTMDFLGEKDQYGEDNDCFLWVEFESENKHLVPNHIEKIFEALGGEYLKEKVLYAQDSKDIDKLWKIRKRVGEACLAHGEFKDFDYIV